MFTQYLKMLRFLVLLAPSLALADDVIDACIDASAGPIAPATVIDACIDASAAIAQPVPRA